MWTTLSNRPPRWSYRPGRAALFGLCQSELSLCTITSEMSTSNFESVRFWTSRICRVGLVPAEGRDRSNYSTAGQARALQLAQRLLGSAAGVSALVGSTLHPTPYTLHPTPCTLHPTPYTLHPTPCTLHPAPYTLHPAPCTLHPTPYTLHPTP